MRLPRPAVFALCLTALAVLGGCNPRGENFTFYASADRVGPWQGPACDSPDVVKQLIKRFNYVDEVYWPRDLRMAAVTRIREGALRDWDPPIIATRYCNATAYFSDGRRRELVYWLRSEQGFAGADWGMQYCVVGLDEHMAYAPACRMLRPI